MNFIEYIMYELCADYETGILDYVFRIWLWALWMIMIKLWRGRENNNNTYITQP